MTPIKVGLLGIGTVGSGTFKVLQRNQQEIQRRAGRAIEIAMVADLDVERARSVVGDGVRVVSDARQVIADPAIDVVVELIGGYGIAKALVLEAIAAGKHVVTANKALLAVHGTEIFAAARAKGVVVAFEAAVAGGIPIIKALREGLTANRIEWIAGIINGTTNFILSEMRSKGLDFDVVLKEAQRLGYAEADPTFDIEGVDAAHKATIMSAIAFGTPVLPIAEVVTSFYLRLRVADEAGVLAKVTALLAERGISIDALLQRESGEGESQTDVIILTHSTVEGRMREAIAAMQSLPTVLAPIVSLRKEELA